MAKKLLKFGGSSIATSRQIRNVSAIISNQTTAHELAVVVSAIGGVTDQLNRLGTTAGEGKIDSGLWHSIKEKHAKILDDLHCCEDTRCCIEAIFSNLHSDLSLVAQSRDLTSKHIDKILSYGELLSATIIADFLNQNGTKSQVLDAREVVLTDNHFGHAYVHYQRTYNRIRSYCNDREAIQIITGFLGATEDGETTTLGRSGSDYSASIFGAALNVDEIEIWTDVNGILTADPAIVADEKTITHLTYEEAMELAHAGAKVIFPPTMIPAKYKKIPIRIKNTKNRDHPGSLVTHSRKINGEKAVGISSLLGISLLRFQGAGMVGVHGVNSRIFSALAKEKISVLLVSQAFSEHATCFAVDPNLVKKAISVLEKEFAVEMEHHYIDPIRVEDHLSMVAVVGEGMRSTPGISGLVFGRLGKENINIVAIAQGSSMRNISFIISEAEVDDAMNALHNEFFETHSSGLNLYLFGVGTVGSELLSILANKGQSHLRIKGVASSQKMLLDAHGLNLDNLKSELNASSQPLDMDAFLQSAARHGRKKVLVDCTASESLSKDYGNMLEHGFSIVTANKIANTLDYQYYQSLRETAEEKGLSFFYEANVGAGLPVISTLQNLLATGDEIISIEGIFSGTLSYLFNSYTSEMAFSNLVKEAKSKGFTEPDPRDDLNGKDVARKLLILARESGANMELADVAVESLLPPGSASIESIDGFFDHLSQYDKDMKTMAGKSERENKKLRYIGKFENGTASVSLKKVGTDHPFYELQGSDNMVAFRTARYPHQPLVVRGAGAGAAVTAAGVLGDIYNCIT